MSRALAVAVLLPLLVLALASALGLAPAPAVAQSGDAFTEAAGRRSELPSRSTGFTADPRTTTIVWAPRRGPSPLAAERSRRER